MNDQIVYLLIISRLQIIRKSLGITRASVSTMWCYTCRKCDTLCFRYFFICIVIENWHFCGVLIFVTVLTTVLKLFSFEQTMGYIFEKDEQVSPEWVRNQNPIFENKLFGMTWEKYFHCIHGKSLITICFTMWNLHIVSFCQCIADFWRKIRSCREWH